MDAMREREECLGGTTDGGRGSWEQSDSGCLVEKVDVWGVGQADDEVYGESRGEWMTTVRLLNNWPTRELIQKKTYHFGEEKTGREGI